MKYSEAFGKQVDKRTVCVKLSKQRCQNKSQHELVKIGCVCMFSSRLRWFSLSAPGFFPQSKNFNNYIFSRCFYPKCKTCEFIQLPSN